MGLSICLVRVERETAGQTDLNFEGLPYDLGISQIRAEQSDTVTGRDCKKSLRSSYLGLNPQNGQLGQYEPASLAWPETSYWQAKGFRAASTLLSCSGDATPCRMTGLGIQPRVG